MACGRRPWFPRRAGGRDLFDWLLDTTFFEQTPDQLPAPAARLGPTSRPRAPAAATTCTTGRWPHSACASWGTSSRSTGTPPHSRMTCRRSSPPETPGSGSCATRSRRCADGSGCRPRTSRRPDGSTRRRRPRWTCAVSAPSSWPPDSARATPSGSTSRSRRRAGLPGARRRRERGGTRPALRRRPLPASAPLVTALRCRRRRHRDGDSHRHPERPAGLVVG